MTAERETPLRVDATAPQAVLGRLPTLAAPVAELITAPLAPSRSRRAGRVNGVLLGWRETMREPTISLDRSCSPTRLPLELTPRARLAPAPPTLITEPSGGSRIFWRSFG